MSRVNFIAPQVSLQVSRTQIIFSCDVHQHDVLIRSLKNLPLTATNKIEIVPVPPDCIANRNAFLLLGYILVPPWYLSLHLSQSCLF